MSLNVRDVSKKTRSPEKPRRHLVFGNQAALRRNEVCGAEDSGVMKFLGTTSFKTHTTAPDMSMSGAVKINDVEVWKPRQRVDWERRGRKRKKRQLQASNDNMHYR